MMLPSKDYKNGKKESMTMVKRTKYCYKRSDTDGFARSASTTSQMRLPFDNGIELAPPPAVS